MPAAILVSVLQTILGGYVSGPRCCDSIGDLLIPSFLYYHLQPICMDKKAVIYAKHPTFKIEVQYFV